MGVSPWPDCEVIIDRFDSGRAVETHCYLPTVQTKPQNSNVAKIVKIAPIGTMS